jgi:hypothetical protein
LAKSSPFAQVNIQLSESIRYSLENLTPGCGISICEKAQSYLRGHFPFSAKGVCIFRAVVRLTKARH